MDASLAVLANRLIEEEAIKFGAFKLKLHEKNPEAPLSPFYIDLRSAVRDPSFRLFIAQAFLDKINTAKVQFERIADIPLSISPIVTHISDVLEVGQLTIRPEKKERGTQAVILGSFQAGQKVLLCDDLITKADSKIEAIEALKSAGLIVEDVLVLVDREQGGTKQLQELGITLHAVFGWRVLCDYYHQKGYIDRERYQEITQYLNW
jgi:uridine monophosphate synthetase